MFHCTALELRESCSMRTHWHEVMKSRMIFFCSVFSTKKFAVRHWHLDALHGQTAMLQMEQVLGQHGSADVFRIWMIVHLLYMPCCGEGGRPRFFHLNEHRTRDLATIWRWVQMRNRNPNKRRDQFSFKTTNLLRLYNLKTCDGRNCFSQDTISLVL